LELPETNLRPLLMIAKEIKHFQQNKLNKARLYLVNFKLYPLLSSQIKMEEKSGTETIFMKCQKQTKLLIILILLGSKNSSLMT